MSVSKEKLEVLKDQAMFPSHDTGTNEGKLSNSEKHTSNTYRLV